MATALDRPPASPHVRVVEDASFRYLLHCGEGFARLRLPRGTRVLYSPPPVEAAPDVLAAVRHALDHPLGSDPLDALLRPGMKVTIAFDDISLPLPQMRRPDVREVVIEEVLRRLARHGVTDVHLIAALALHRRMTEAELRHCVGPRVHDAHAPAGRLYNHDAEDPDGLVLLGKTALGEEAWINRRAAESDLVVYVNINLVAMDGGHKSVPVGLTNYRSLRAHHSVHGMMHSRSYMDPRASEMHRSCARLGRVVAEHVRIFTIETTLDSRCFGFPIGYLLEREERWGVGSRLLAETNRLALDVLPMPLRRAIFHAMRAPYGVTGVHAGATDAVHERTLENVHRQQLVEVDGPSDVVVAGLPFVGPYNVNSIMNPLLVNCLGMGYVFNLYRGVPLVKKGGVMIFLHPVEEAFHPVHHPSYVDFYQNILPQTRDPAEIERRWEEQYATDPRYVDLYRHSHAYHGVHPFYMWYWACHGMSWVGKIIYVRPRSERAARRIGGEVARSFEEALDMARSHVGKSDPSIAVFHMPPILLADVRSG
jgi:hypothetical protein